MISNFSTNLSLLSNNFGRITFRPEKKRTKTRISLAILSHNRLRLSINLQLELERNELLLTCHGTIVVGI